MTGSWLIGVDLGGTKIETGLVSGNGQVVDRRRMPTQAWKGPQFLVEQVAGAVQELSALVPPGERIAALGICAPGPVDFANGTLVDPPNLAGLHNAPLRRMLAARLGIPVALDHDAKATALGEYYYGAGRGAQSMVFIIAGTGVGGAIIDRGELIRGPYNSAGEIGHITLDRQGELCSCGSRGCVETFISGPWLARRYARAQAGLDGGQPGGEEITGETVAARAAQGDALALQVLSDAGQALGVAVATLAMLFDVDLFVVGGSVARCGDLLLDPARREIQQHAYRSVGSGICLVASEISGDAPILGCAWLARQAAGEFPAGAAAQPSGKTVAAGSPPQTAAWEAVEGTIFDIQRFSVHDGPGIRTNVFLKGCSLRCPWCANPESQRPHAELAFTAQRCMRCGQFLDACADVWSGAETQAARQKYGERVQACPTCGIRWLGARQTAGEVIGEVLQDLAFYGHGGGLTLTGGEPTLQPRFSEALLRLARARGIDTAMETNGHTRWAILERLVPFLDHLLWDIKHLDPEIHRRHTGVDNVLILANLRRLAAAGAPLELRLPLIPGFNADVENLEAVADLILQVEGLKKELCLLPYHTLGRPKYHSLGRAYPWESYSLLAQDEIERLADAVRSRGVHVVLGG
jgi:glycyl-radical enzyme activating protein/glucokinase-like ROK family protein